MDLSERAVMTVLRAREPKEPTAGEQLKGREDAAWLGVQIRYCEGLGAYINRSWRRKNPRKDSGCVVEDRWSRVSA